MNKLNSIALKSIDNAYAPYSGYRVGAALLTSSGKIYSGCNIENRSFTPTVCAERTAVFKAISDGEQDFSSMVVACEDEVPATPCGVCLQVLSEFVSPEFEILSITRDGEQRQYKMSELLGSPFRPSKGIGKHS